MKKLFIQILLGVVSAASVCAQDIIVKKNGTEIKGKVTEVGIDKVTYKISSDLNGANFVIRKSELKQIEFGTGETVSMINRNDPRIRKNPTNYDEAFGRSMLNFSPFKALDSGPGIGASYEILVDKRQLIGVILPVSIIFPDSYGIGYGSRSGGKSLVYLSPGVKIYPFGQRRVTYAVGPNLFTGFGQIRSYETTYDPVTNNYTSGERTMNNFRLGVLVNNYINFQITQHFQITLNGGLGSRYVNRKDFGGSTINRENIRVTGEFNFNLGFRF
jgi:hypothetical protein